MEESDSVLRPRPTRISAAWELFGKRVSKSEVVYVCQIVLIYILVITSIINLSVGDQDREKYWYMLISACLGIACPSPQPH